MDIILVTNYKIKKTYKPTSRCLKHLDHTSIYSLQILIAKTIVNTTRRCDLTAILNAWAHF